MRVALAAWLIVVLIELVRWNPWVLWPLQGTAVGLLAGATAWCFDEAAAAVVDPLPRGLAWRTAARASGVALLAATWIAVVIHAQNTVFFGHRNAMLVQGLSAMLACGALALWRRSRAEATPGLSIATAVVPTTTVWALVRPLSTSLPVFPYGTATTGAWLASTVVWAAIGVAACVLAAFVLADLRRRPVGPSRSSPRDPDAGHSATCTHFAG